MNFTVPGKLHGKGRPRFTRAGHAYTDPITRAYERRIAAAYKAAGGVSFGSSPIELYVEARFPIPKSTSKANKLKMLMQKLFPCKRPDIDNIVKAVADGLNGVAYDDDAQIVRLEARKKYSEQEGLFIIVGKYDPLL